MRNLTWQVVGSCLAILAVTVAAYGGASYPPPVAGNGITYSGGVINFSACRGNNNAEVTTSTYTLSAANKDLGCTVPFTVTSTVTVPAAATLGNGSGSTLVNECTNAAPCTQTVNVPTGAGPEGLSTFTLPLGGACTFEIDQSGVFHWPSCNALSSSGGAVLIAGSQMTGRLATTAVTLTDAASMTPALTGNEFDLTLSTNTTWLCPTSILPGSYDFNFVQDATGGRTLTLPSCMLFPTVSGTVQTPVLTTAANAHDKLHCDSDGTTTLYCGALNAKFATTAAPPPTFAFVRESTFDGSFSGFTASTTTSTPNVPTAGNTLLVLLTVQPANATVALTASGGATSCTLATNPIAQSANNNAIYGAACRVTSTAPVTLTATANGGTGTQVSSFTLYSEEWSGIAASPIDGASGTYTNGSGSATSLPCGNITTTAAGDLIWTVAESLQSVAPTLPTGFTAHTIGEFGGAIYSAAGLQASPGTVNYSWTSGVNSFDNDAYCMALK